MGNIHSSIPVKSSVHSTRSVKPAYLPVNIEIEILSVPDQVIKICPSNSICPATYFGFACRYGTYGTKELSYS